MHAYILYTHTVPYYDNNYTHNTLTIKIIIADTYTHHRKRVLFLIAAHVHRDLKTH